MWTPILYNVFSSWIGQTYGLQEAADLNCRRNGNNENASNCTTRVKRIIRLHPAAIHINELLNLAIGIKAQRYASNRILFSMLWIINLYEGLKSFKTKRLAKSVADLQVQQPKKFRLSDRRIPTVQPLATWMRHDDRITFSVCEYGKLNRT